VPIRRAPRTSSAPTARGHVSARRGDRAAMTSAYRIASRCACLVLLAAAGPCAPAPTAGQRGALAGARCGSASAGAGAHLEAAADVGEATAAVRPRVQCLLQKGAQHPHHGRHPGPSERTTRSLPGPTAKVVNASLKKETVRGFALHICQRISTESSQNPPPHTSAAGRGGSPEEEGKRGEDGGGAQTTAP